MVCAPKFCEQHQLSVLKVLSIPRVWYVCLSADDCCHARLTFLADFAFRSAPLGSLFPGHFKLDYK